VAEGEEAITDVSGLEAAKAGGAGLPGAGGPSGGMRRMF